MLFIIKAFIAFIQEAKYDYKKKKSMTSKDILVVVMVVGALIAMSASINKTTRLAVSLREQKEKVAELEAQLKSKNQCQVSSDSGKSYSMEGLNGLVIPAPRTDCMSPYCIP